MMDTSPSALVKLLPAPIRKPADLVVSHLQHGTFQRSMSLLVFGTSLVSGAEVAYEHYRGSYSNPIMYSPVILSGVLSAAGVAGFFNRRMARTFLRYTSWLTLADGLIGFGFHIRGIARKPGGWRMPVVNLVMGPPVFAPLLFGTSAYLGVIASYLQREEDHGWKGRTIEAVSTLRKPGFRRRHPRRPLPEASLRGDRGRYARFGCGGLVLPTTKNNFKYKVQWSPILLTPLLAGAALASLPSRRVANTLLPVAAGLAMLNGVVGTGYHIRGYPPASRRKKEAALQHPVRPTHLCTDALRRVRHARHDGLSHAPGAPLTMPDSPIDPRNRKPLAPRDQPGYYPGFSTVSQKAYWDAKTRAVVLARLEPPKPLRFFTPARSRHHGRPWWRASCRRRTGPQPGRSRFCPASTSA